MLNIPGRWRTVAALAVLAAGGATVLHGQAQAPAAQAAPERLPVRRVVLYKSGIGYFEHLGQVRGNQDVTIEFTSSQLDDVLKSLTALDLDGGKVASVNYNSEAGLERRLGALRLPLDASATRGELLMALRGARIEVRTGASRLAGRLLSVERQDRRADGAVTSVDVLSLVTDAGDIQSVVLDPGVTVHIAETALTDEVGRYLSIISSSREQDVRRLTISTTGQGQRDLFVSYVSEVPVWKSTYRLVLGGGEAGKPAAPVLQGWAIVDNTIGEDWNNVELSLVAGAPQAFIQRISQPYYVQRPVVPLPERVLMSPQTHQGTLTTSGAGGITGTVRDASGGAIPGATVFVTRSGMPAGTVVTDGGGNYRLTGLPAGSYDVSVTLTGFRPASASGIRVSSGSETALSHVLEVGSMSESVAVDAISAVAVPSPPPARPVGGVGGGRGGGAGSGAGLGLAGRVDQAQAALQAGATGDDLGDLFEYKLKEPITILKNQSALVPIVTGSVGAEKVSVWNAASGSRRPLRAIWITNSTGQTLDAGSVSIVEGQAFAGEGLIESLKAGEKRLLSYAQDLAMTVTAGGDPTPSRLTRAQLTRGALVLQREDRQQRVYTARNEDSQPRTLVVEHPVRAGWTLGGDLKPVESSADAHRFRLTVAPGSTATFTVDETRPVESRVTIASVTENQLQVWIAGRVLDEPTLTALREVLRRKAVIAGLSSQISTRELEISAISRDQERVRENMKSLKGTAEERQLVQRYVRQLDAQETRLETLRSEVASLAAQRDAAQAELNKFIDGLGI
jgi:hypothetical protein